VLLVPKTPKSLASEVDSATHKKSEATCFGCIDDDAKSAMKISDARNEKNWMADDRPILLALIVMSTFVDDAFWSRIPVSW